MIKKTRLFILIIFLLALAASCLVSAAPKILIGLSVDTLKEAGRQTHRDIFITEAEKLGAQVLVETAENDDALQVTQSQKLLSRGVKALVIIPHNPDACAPIVESANKLNVKTISYERLIENCNPDLYIAFDMEKSGYWQAFYIFQKAPKGAYAYIGGSPTDRDAILLKSGAMKVLKPLIDEGVVKLVYDEFTPGGDAEMAKTNMARCLAEVGNKIDAVIAANDTIASGVFLALADQKLAGKVPVSGEGAELSACQRIVDGNQYMTVYKPIKLIASEAAKAAVALAEGRQVETGKTVDNGKNSRTPYLALIPTAVGKININVIIRDGCLKEEDIYRNAKK